MTRYIAAAFGATLTVLVSLTAGLGLLTGGIPSSGCNALSPNASTAVATISPARPTTPTDWDQAQLGNAATIIAVGSRLGVPPRGQVVALATAIQESSLRNLPGGDTDSLGLFQQRPSQGWGTPVEILTPDHAATSFYRALLAVPDWQAMPLTAAADAVQRSAFPSAYADDEPAATQLYTTLTGTNAAAAAVSPSCAGVGVDADAGKALPAGFTLPADTTPPAATAIGWALQQLGTPYRYGGDCTEARSGDPARQCDCSSLTQRAYAAAGIALPRTAAEQSRAGIPIPLGDLHPGDLIFSAGALGTAANPGHVALYLGDGLLIEAPHTGADVRIARLDAARLSSIVVARRFIPAG
jgi:cell wall-associated NlpC family hydrolase